MTERAVADGPIMVFTGLGTWVQIPLSDIIFKDSKPEAKGEYAGDSNVNSWLAYLASTGSLRAVKASPAVTVFDVAASAVGSTGNDIRVDVLYLSATQPKVYTVVVTKTDVYSGLKYDEKGLRAAFATRPGLVKIDSPLTLAGLPAKGERIIPPKSNKFEVPAEKTTEGSLILTPSDTSPGSELVAVTVKRAPTEEDTFTVTASWTNNTTIDASNLTTSAAEAKLNDVFGYVVKFHQKSDGLPQSGTFYLRGGGEAVKAVNATLSLDAS